MALVPEGGPIISQASTWGAEKVPWRVALTGRNAFCLDDDPRRLTEDFPLFHVHVPERKCPGRNTTDADRCQQLHAKRVHAFSIGIRHGAVE